ncbi:MAG: DUF3857 domain-containing protein [Myxococcota bacterium]
MARVVLLLAVTLTLGATSSACGGAKARELDSYGGQRIDPSRYVDAPAVMLLEEVELTYAFDPGRFQPYAELRRHRRIQILTDEARKRFGRVYVPMTRRAEPRAIQARLIHPDGESKELDNTTLDFNRFSGSDKAAGLYQEPAAKAFAVPGLRVGDVIDYQSIHIIRDPRWVEPLVAGEGLHDLPIKEARLSVVHAPGYDVDYRVTVRGDLIEMAPERVPARIFDPVKGDNSELDATRFIWLFTDLPATFPEPRGSTALAAATQVHVQFKRYTPPGSSKSFLGYSTWEDVAAWYRELMGPVDKGGQSLAPDAAGGRTKRDKLKAVQKGCGQMQLLDLDVNLGALKPHKAGEIASAKKGDSKDLAQACLSATRAANLDAFPVLVARRSHRPRVPDLPTPAAFDHVIIAVPGAGQYDYFDPAGLGAPVGRPLPFSQGGDGIVVRPDGIERVIIPEDKAEQNTREVTYKLVLGVDGMVEGNASFKLVGQDVAFVRQAMRELKGEEQYRALSEWLCGGEQKLPWTEAQLQGGEDPDEPARLLVTFGKAPLGGVQDKLALRMAELLGKPYPFLWRDGRLTPVDLGYRMTERVTASVLMPEGHGVRGRPADLVDENAMAKVEQRYAVADGSLWLRRERVQKEAFIPRQRYDELKDIYQRIWSNLSQSAPVLPGGERGRDYGSDPF